MEFLFLPSSLPYQPGGADSSRVLVGAVANYTFVGSNVTTTMAGRWAFGFVLVVQKKAGMLKSTTTAARKDINFNKQRLCWPCNSTTLWHVE
ncbi:MAG: hypothetical protein IPO03_02310 [Bacteroidetes bacterium]|nr:hypothetical protein [Bacteroidota bacterium]